MKTKITEADYVRAATELKCEVEAIKAVAAIESRGEGFDSNGRPVILFEAHLFSRLTNHKYDKTHPKLSSKTWNKSLYGKMSEQHTRLSEASQLNVEAALMSCSWGKFQILGENHKLCGYKDVYDMVDDMYVSEVKHLDAFVQFVKSNSTLLNAIQTRKWAVFARKYNGPDYKANQYDTKIEREYNKLKVKK